MDIPGKVVLYSTGMPLRSPYDKRVAMDFIQYITWRPEIGDPSLMGWLTVAAYGVTAILCATLAAGVDRRFPLQEAPTQKRVWWSLAVVLFLLCINKQLDIQSLFTDIGRAMSRSQGWYEQRRDVQKWFVLALGVAGAATLVVSLWIFRLRLRENWMVLQGSIFLGTFILVRAVSFHHFDRFISWKPGGVRMNWILELTGIFLIAAKALIELHRKRLPRADRIPMPKAESSEVTGFSPLASPH